MKHKQQAAQRISAVATAIEIADKTISLLMGGVLDGRHADDARSSFDNELANLLAKKGS